MAVYELIYTMQRGQNEVSLFKELDGDIAIEIKDACLPNKHKIRLTQRDAKLFGEELLALVRRVDNFYSTH